MALIICNVSIIFSYWQHGLVQVQGRGKKRGHQPKEVSAEALDADLEKYREQAMFK